MIWCSTHPTFRAQNEGWGSKEETKIGVAVHWWWQAPARCAGEGVDGLTVGEVVREACENWEMNLENSINHAGTIEPET